MSESAQQPFDFIRDYLASTFELAPQDLTGERTFDSLGLDSIAQVEMFVTLSDHYGVHLDDSLASGDMTLQQTADRVEAELRDPARPPQGSTAPTR